MKNKNPWKLLRCIGIAPWKIASGERRFVFDGPDGGPDTPDAGASDESEDEGGETEDADDAGESPADTETSARAAAQRSVETGQGGLVRNAALTHESSQQYLRRLFESLPPALKADDEAQKAYLDAHTDLDLANTVEDRVAIIENLQTQIDNYDLSRYAPPPAGEAEEGEEDGAEVLPPAAATEGGAGEAQAAHTEAAPKRPALSAERRGELTQDFILNQRPDGQKRIVPKGEVTADGFKKVFGVDINATDKRSREAIKAAVWAKQESLNKTLASTGKPKIKVDGIFGPETFLAIQEVDKPTLAQLKAAPAAPAAAPVVVAESRPAGAPAPAGGEAAHEAAPPKVTQLPNFPEYKAPPSLPEFFDDRFYTIEVHEFLGIDLGTTSEDQLKKWGVEEGAVVYVRSGDPVKGKAITVETAAGKTFNIDGGNLESLGNDDEKRTIYMGQRYELLSGANQRDYLSKVDIKNVRSYRDQLVCIDRDAKSPGPGLVVVKHSDGTVEAGGVPESELEEVNQQDKYAYLVETYDNLDRAMRSNILPVDRAAYQEAISRAPADIQKRKGLAEGAPLEVKVARDCPLFYIDSRGKTWTVTKVDEFVREGAKVSVLGKTENGKYLRVATSDGFTGFIETSRTDGNIIAKAKPSAAPPTVVAAAPATAPAPAPPPAPAAAAAPRRPVIPAPAAPPAPAA